MNIAFILSKPPGYSETFFRSKIRGLQEAGYQISLYVQTDDPSFKDCKVYTFSKVYYNPIRQMFAILAVFVSLIPYCKRVIRFVKLEKDGKRKNSQILKNIYINAKLLKANLDWLHFGFATMVLQREYLAEAIKAKMGVSLRGFDIAIYPIKHPGCYSLLWSQVDKVHYISDDLLQLAYQNGLAKDKTAEKITPAIDIHKFVATFNRKPKDTLQFCTVARLHWKKGIIDTLEALARLTHVNFMYTIVGEGEDYDVISFAIHQLNLVNKVCLKGKVEHKEVINLMNATDVYLQYSVSEGFCNAVLEAQAMGCLCVVSDAEGLSENVIDGETGWVVAKGQPKLLAERIEQVLELGLNDKNRVKCAAKQRIKTQFNLELQQAAFVKFYKF